MTIFSTEPRAPKPSAVEGTGGTFAAVSFFGRYPYHHRSPRQITLDHHVPNHVDIASLHPSSRFTQLRAAQSSSERGAYLELGMNNLKGPDYVFSSFNVANCRHSAAAGSLPKSPRGPVAAPQLATKNCVLVNLSDETLVRLSRTHDAPSAAFRLPTVESPRGRTDDVVSAPHVYEGPHRWIPSSWHKNSPRTRDRAAKIARRRGASADTSRVVVVEGHAADDPLPVISA